VAKAIVQAVQQQEPSGRFLEMHDKDTGTWKQINYKRCVDKTSQALREKETKDKYESIHSDAAKAAAQAAHLKKQGKVKGASDLKDLTKATLKQAGLEGTLKRGQEQNMMGMGMHVPTSSNTGDSKRKAIEPSSTSDFRRMSWWNRPVQEMNGNANSNKRIKIEDSMPSPPTPLEVRQSSLFRFLGNSGIFGRNSVHAPAQADSAPIPSSGRFSFSTGPQNTELSNFPGGQASAFGNDSLSNDNRNSMAFMMQQNSGIVSGVNSSLEPVPLPMCGSNGQRQSFAMNEQSQPSTIYSNNNRNNGEPLMEEMPTNGLFPPGMDNAQGYNASSRSDMASAPPPSSLTSQVSDWLTTFWPLEKREEAQPPPPQQNLERGISSTIFNLARSPSQFLTSLKSGVTSIFGGDGGALDAQAPFPTSGMAGTMMGQGGAGNIGNGTLGATQQKRDSLLDDYEESALETRLRSVSSR